jgi:3-deoxy-D-manno-octulosonic-acid transferase
MGLVFSLYQLSEVAIVGGSFTRKGRGHNIFEPIQALTPVLFGPYMSSQKDLVSLVLEEKAGAQGSFEEIPLLLSKLLVDSQDMREQAKHLLAKVKGSSLKTLELICQKVSYLVK